MGSLEFTKNILILCEAGPLRTRGRRTDLLQGCRVSVRRCDSDCEASDATTPRLPQVGIEHERERIVISRLGTGMKVMSVIRTVSRTHQLIAG